MLQSESHILVVDDDNRLRDLLRDFLGRVGYRVTTAASAEEAEAKMQGLVFDMMVLDVMMPGESGIQFVQRLRQKQSADIPVLLLTALGETEDRIKGFEGGADDYLVKPFEPRELVLRIEAILRRVMAEPVLMDEAHLQKNLYMGDFIFDPEKKELTKNGQLVKLTTSETQLLSIFAQRNGETISRSELSELVSAASERAVDVQVTRLRKKIEKKPKSPRYLQTVWGAGYALVARTEQGSDDY